MQQLPGILFQYCPEKPQLVAFRSAIKHAESNKYQLTRGVVILIAGMTEGPLALPFTTALNQTLYKCNWELVQPVLSSSYTGFGIASLDQDVAELEYLIEKLFKDGHKRIVLLGHSTGAQIALHYARTGRHRTRIAGCLLQGAVSDRQYYRHLTRQLVPEGQIDAWLDYANKLRQSGRGNTLMPREAYVDAPITADRFFSLVAPGGQDDMFSTDLTLAQVAEIYKGVCIPMGMVQSAEDQYVPDPTQLPGLLERHHRAYAGYRLTRLIPNADHGLSSKEAQKAFCDIVRDFVMSF